MKKKIFFWPKTKFLLLTVIVFIAGSYRLTFAQEGYWSLGYTWAGQSCSTEYPSPHVAGTWGEIVMFNCMSAVEHNPTLFGGCRLGSGTGNYPCEADIFAFRNCPEGYIPRGTKCIPPEDKCNNNGNPINRYTGTKSQTEIDYQGQGQFPLIFTRHYSSLQGYWNYLPNLSMGVNSVSSSGREPHPLTAEVGGVTFSDQSTFFADGFQLEKLIITDFDGSQYVFEKVSGDWKLALDNGSILLENTDSMGSLVGYTFTKANRESLEFDTEGQILKHSTREGVHHTYSYSLDNTQITVTHNVTQQQLVIGRDASLRVSSLTVPGGFQYRYAFDSESRLQYVSFPDGTVGASGSNPFGEDNPFVEYHYENSSHKYALTGVTDARGVRYATWDYDFNGRAYVSKHEAPSSGVGIDEVVFDFSNMSILEPYAKVTSSLEQTTDYYFDTINGTRKPKHIRQNAISHPVDSTVGCAVADRYTSYDTNGYKNVVVDWEGNATDYDYDAQGREIQRMEDLLATIDTTNTPHVITGTALTGETRTISTEWHPDFRLPTRITEPNKVTDMTYNCDNGRLINRQIYAAGSEPNYTPPSCP